MSQANNYCNLNGVFVDLKDKQTGVFVEHETRGFNVEKRFASGKI